MLRCPQCRTRRATYESMQKHIKESGHTYCDCGGYHYKHRIYSPYCHHNEMSPLLHAMRCADLTDEEIEDIALDLALNAKSKKSNNNDCPF